MVLVVTLTVNASMIEAFRDYERRAARIIARHGGAIERTIVIPMREASEFLREVHIVTFPDEQAFTAYRADPELAALAGLRERAIARAEILIGEEGPDYHSGPETA